jgi:hypothetical protein
MKTMSTAGWPSTTGNPSGGETIIHLVNKNFIYLVISIQKAKDIGLLKDISSGRLPISR